MPSAQPSVRSSWVGSFGTTTAKPVEPPFATTEPKSLRHLNAPSRESSTGLHAAGTPNPAHVRMTPATHDNDSGKILIDVDLLPKVALDRLIAQDRECRMLGLR